MRDNKSAREFANSRRKKLINNENIRQLTPIEYERLQSFPDGWTDNIKHSLRYVCLGNSVTVNVVRSIIGGM